MSLFQMFFYSFISHLLGTRPADVRPEHDLVGGFSVHIRLVKLAVEDLQVTASAVDVLLMFHGELDY